jgi:hypothetical protein
MDRALDLDSLTAAVGTHASLPSPERVQELLAQTEISLFTGQAEVDDQLIDTGWYLQSVATARPDLQLYSLPRQRRAHQVSGHIFDLVLRSAELSYTERLRYTFASQVAYLGGEVTPNASAIARRVVLPAAPFVWTDPGRISLEVGITVLALDRAALYPLLVARRRQLDNLRNEHGELSITLFDAVAGVVDGSWALINYLTYGREASLDIAQRLFSAAVATTGASADVDSRWVAAHLVRISGQLATTSVWGVMPPNLSRAARAMTLGEPPVLSLWPPQLSFLKANLGSESPLDPSSRRLIGVVVTDVS